jgi:hypothetical protein
VKLKTEKSAMHGFLKFRLDHGSVPKKAALTFPSLIDE